MRYFALLLLAAALATITACQPGDAKSRSTKERLERGELVEFTEDGYLRPSCSGRAWEDMRLNDRDERNKVVVGKIQSGMAAGMKTCHQIGSNVYMTVAGRGGPELGFVRIKKIGLVKAWAVKKAVLAGKFYQNTDKVNEVLNRTTARLKPEDQEVLTIITFDYVAGTAADEAQVIADEAAADEEPAGDGYSETLADGQTISSCNGKFWSDMRVQAALQPSLMDGTLKSVYRLGDNNCVQQGAVIDVTVVGSAPFMKAKVVKIKKFRWKMAVANYFVLNGFNFAELQNLIATDPYAGKSEWITVVDLEGAPRE